jgi:FKBP-type peptidyl-prolyl cis-trans isomerase
MQGPLEYANKQLIKTEDEEINNFIARYKWKMSTSGTGLRYNIYSSGNGKKAAPGSKVKINYVVRLINGDIIYSSEINGPREFIIGKSNAEPGLEEAVLLMRQGDRAKLIIPSHLAFGLHGDENKVPKRATLIYDLEILSINDQ